MPPRPPVLGGGGSGIWSGFLKICAVNKKYFSCFFLSIVLTAKRTPLGVLFPEPSHSLEKTYFNLRNHHHGCNIVQSADRSIYIVLVLVLLVCYGCDSVDVGSGNDEGSDMTATATAPVMGAMTTATVTAAAAAAAAAAVAATTTTAAAVAKMSMAAHTTIN